MSAATAIRDFIEPLLPGWRIQQGRWIDGAKEDRYAVLRATGGPPAELVREPQFSLMFIGAVNDATAVPADAADAVIEAMRAGSGSLVFMQPAEPVFIPTADGRPAFEVAVSAITN